MARKFSKLQKSLECEFTSSYSNFVI